MTGQQIRVVIADDQDVVRSGYRLICNAAPEIEIVGEAASGVEAVSAAVMLEPDVMIMDVRMPGMDGIEATAQIRERFGENKPHVLVLTTFGNDKNLYAALRAGASSFLLKDAPADDIVRAIRLAAQGEAVLAPSITTMLVRRHVQPFADQPRDERLSTLTERELEVMLLISNGLSNVDIGKELFIAERTVKSHVTGLLTKLELRSRVQFAIFAYESGVYPRDN